MLRVASATPLRLLLAVVLALLAYAVTAQAAMAADDGAVYTLTNQAGGNEVAVFDRSGNGTLTSAGAVSTGGNGTGAGLGSQGALIRDGNRLLAVNAGSNSVSLLRARGTNVRLLDVAPSGGTKPISVTAHGHLVYVLHEGDASNAATIHGFVRLGGQLIPLPGSSRPLSTAAPGPAQIEFTPDGQQLVVTEKMTNRIVTYRIGFLGYAGAPRVSPSAGQTPFGFAFDPHGRAIVSEAFGGAPDASVLSSYEIERDGSVDPIDANVATTETAACWVVVTKNGKYAYTTNTGSSSVSGYEIGRDGELTLLDPDGRTGLTGAGTSPIDAALANDGKFLYVLTGGTTTIAGFRVNGDGSLDSLGSVGGLPAGSVGLAAS
jgi:6-phosphogluconolactonase